MLQVGSQNKDYKDFLKRVLEFIEVRSFMAIYEFIMKSGVCPDTNRREWFNTLAYMHTKGWLYVSTDKGALKLVVGAYRVKDLDNCNKLPENEEGKILYVPFAVSEVEDRMVFKNMLSRYLGDNPDIEEIAFFERNSDAPEKFRRFRLTKEDTNVEQESTNAPIGTTVPREPSGTAKP